MNKGGEIEKNVSRQIDNKLSMQVRIDRKLHRKVKIRASMNSISIKQLLEDYIIEGLNDETI